MATFRKARDAKGVTTRMMSFRVDLENADYLETKPNKGRFINGLIAAARQEEERDPRT